MTLKRTWDSAPGPIDVDEALRRVLASISALPVIQVGLIDALGLTLAEDMHASQDVPPFDNSAMDGFAIRSTDTAYSLSRPLRVIDSIAAGDAPRVSVGPGEAARIMTGAPIPRGADAVVRFEEADELGHPGEDTHQLSVERTIRAGENVRLAGEDVRQGDRLLRASDVLGAAEIGLLAATNVSAIPVHRRPVVAILSTGDELVAPGGVLRAGQISDSNTYVIHALVRQAGGEPRVLGVAGDSASDLLDRLGSEPCPDVFVTSGGVSVGDYDAVKDVLQAHGSIELWQVRMKPGRPLAFGHLGQTPLLGLPGNPLAAYVSFLQFGRALIRKMLGRAELTLPMVDARLMSPVENRGNRRQFIPGVLTRERGCYVVQPAAGRGLGIVSSAGKANSLIVVPDVVARLDAGSTVAVQLLDGEQV